MGQAYDMFPDRGDDKDACRAATNAIEGEILKLGVVVGNIKSNGEYSKGVQENDTQRDLSARDLDCLVAGEVSVLRGREENDVPAHQREEGRYHDGP